VERVARDYLEVAVATVEVVVLVARLARELDMDME